MNTLSKIFALAFFAFSFSTNIAAQNNNRVKTSESDLDFLGKTNHIVFQAKAYPNPTMGAVSIAYQLSEETPITIALYDLQGREIQTITNSETQVAGNYEIALNLENLSNSYYLCRIVSKQSTQLIRILKVD